MQAYKACHEPFIRYCSSLTFGKMETDDLVQDVLLSAYHHFERIQKKENLLHYLIRAARNRSISIWRKRRFQQALLEQHTEHLASTGLSPETILDIQLLYKALDKLPAKQKHALILFEISGFSMKEIAAIQGSTPGAVKTKISRGRKALRELLQDEPTTRPLSGILHTAQSITL